MVPLERRMSGDWFPLRALLLMLVSVLLLACGQEKVAGSWPGGVKKQKAMPVHVISMQTQSVPIEVEALGQAEGSKEVELRARVSGILLQQRYHEGDRVTAGDVLFKIDPVPFDIALAQARASLALDEASLEKARREERRLQPLIQRNSISRKSYDDAISTLKIAEASAMASEARVHEAELNLSYTHVVAPISGVTGRALHSEGSLVEAGKDSGLLTTLVINDPIWVRFSLSEADARLLRRSKRPAEVKLLNRDNRGNRDNGDGLVRPPAGLLNFSASTVNSDTGTMAFRATFPNRERDLLPGQFVRVKVVLGQRAAMLVPLSALLQNAQGKQVFTVSADNKVSPRSVETQGWWTKHWVITHGLQAGDRVIIDNLMKLRPGAEVVPLSGAVTASKMDPHDRP